MTQLLTVVTGLLFCDYKGMYKVLLLYKKKQNHLRTISSTNMNIISSVYKLNWFYNDDIIQNSVSISDINLVYCYKCLANSRSSNIFVVSFINGSRPN